MDVASGVLHPPVLWFGRANLPRNAEGRLRKEALSNRPTVRFADQRREKRRLVSNVWLQLLGRHGVFSAAQLKTIQEVVTLLVFCVFSILYLKEPLKWNYVVGFGMILGAVIFIFNDW